MTVFHVPCRSQQLSQRGCHKPSIHSSIHPTRRNKKKTSPVFSGAPICNLKTSIRPATPLQPHTPSGDGGGGEIVNTLLLCRGLTKDTMCTSSSPSFFLFLSFFSFFSFLLRAFLFDNSSQLRAAADLRNSRPTTFMVVHQTSWAFVGLSGQEREEVSRRCGCRALPCGNTSPRCDH